MPLYSMVNGVNIHSRVLWTVWESFNNYCVDANGNDLAETLWKAGSSSQFQCQYECMKSKKFCSAYEWYRYENGRKCFLMLGNTPATKGHTGAPHTDAMCFINPANKPSGKKRMSGSILSHLSANAAIPLFYRCASPPPGLRVKVK